MKGTKRTQMRLMLLAAIIGITGLVTMMSPRVARAEDYTYKVRVFSGNKGTVNGEDVVVLECHKGDSINLEDEIDVGITSDSYYHKGFRESGQDAEFPYMSFSVDRDIDLVTSYGMRAQMAKLTVHFREYGTDKPLATDDGSTEATYEYKIGDKPVIAFKHIEGYRPVWRNITGTITEDTDWYLEYIRLEDGETEESAIGTAGVGGRSQPANGREASTDGGRTTTNDRGDDRNAAANGNQNANSDQDANRDQNAADSSADENGNGIEDEQAPPTRSILDNDTPLTNLADSTSELDPISWSEETYGKSMAPTVIAIVLGLGTLFIVISSATILGRLRRSRM